jgi:hypothetical protein
LIAKHLAVKQTVTSEDRQYMMHDARCGCIVHTDSGRPRSIHKPRVSTYKQRKHPSSSQVAQPTAVGPISDAVSLEALDYRVQWDAGAMDQWLVDPL